MTAATRLSHAVVARQVVPRLATFVFNFLQLGLVVLVARSMHFDGGLVLLVAFEIGILIDCLWRRGKLGHWAIVAIAAGLAVQASEYVSSNGLRLCAASLAVLVLAMALKKIRTATDAMGSVKRRWRALGYLTAGFFDWSLLNALLVLTGVVVAVSGAAALRDKPLPEPFRLDRPRIRAYCVVMLHHLHYFAYAYLLVFIFLNEFDASRITIGPLFYVGWIGYYVFTNARKFERTLVVVGHLVAATAVLLMLAAHLLTTYLALWFITGIGGGTIVLFRASTINQDEAVYERFKAWESFGHVAGLLCLALAVWSDVSFIPLVVSGCAGVLCALGAAGRVAPKDRYQ
jgi:hypothetical protein